VPIVELAVGLELDRHRKLDIARMRTFLSRKHTVQCVVAGARGLTSLACVRESGVY
jgi:hypothetical protein